jgi:hypothetical protein
MQSFVCQTCQPTKGRARPKTSQNPQGILEGLDEYDTFEDKGKGNKPGPDYKKINVHIVYAVKHVGRHKSRLVAGGHLTTRRYKQTRIQHCV